MKPLALSSLFSVNLILGAAAGNRSELLSQISLKEQQLAKIQKELVVLRSKLATPSGPGGSYTVKTGDTIHSIARELEVSSASLMECNKISDPTKLAIGRILTIPGTASTQASAAKPGQASKAKTKAKDYVVSKGDTFYSIARRHRMSLDQLKTLNPNVSSHLISPGQVLTVSAPVATTPQPAPTPAPSSPSTTTKTPAIASNPPSARKPDPKPQSLPSASPAPILNVEKEAPAPLPPSPDILKENEPATAPAIPKVILTEEMTFEEFAEKHGTTTDLLNELNGWSLPKSIILARGSEIHLPQ
jgi:LysM repeat protein